MTEENNLTKKYRKFDNIDYDNVFDDEDDKKIKEEEFHMNLALLEHKKCKFITSISHVRKMYPSFAPIDVFVTLMYQAGWSKPVIEKMITIIKEQDPKVLEPYKLTNNKLISVFTGDVKPILKERQEEDIRFQ